MSQLPSVTQSRIYPMAVDMLDRASEVAERLKDHNPVPVETWHDLHGGLYARTMLIPAGVVIVGALVKVPTTLILDGDVSFNAGGDALEAKRLTGRHILLASAGRKQVFAAYEDTMLTMVFATHAKTVADAEAEFTDEAHLLLSRQGEAINHYQITGE